ncbi:MAG: hypothetical protein H0X17_00210 [Deltaproteobacteria bacterium]|nr:hypothetical protein [Deltaproteobacteria bacterium]
MAKVPRFIPPDTLVEVTMRTNAARLHLRPSAELNARILAIIGRALVLYPVMLHAFTFLSNHWHALVTPCDAKALASFLQYVHSNVAKAAQEINGVKGKVWSRKASIIPVLDEDAQRDRLRYILSHGTKEHLVPSPYDWPGASSVRALALGEKLVGRWIDPQAKRRCGRGAGSVNPAQYTTAYPIDLAPLPAHASMTAAERQLDVQQTIAGIEAEHPGPCLGVETVLAQDPNAAPVESKSSTAPAAHTRSAPLRSLYLQLRGDFLAAYRAAAAEHAQRPTSVQWPGNAFLPSGLFVRVDPQPLTSMLSGLSALGSSSA